MVWRTIHLIILASCPVSIILCFIKYIQIHCTRSWLLFASFILLLLQCFTKFVFHKKWWMNKKQKKMRKRWERSGPSIHSLMLLCICDRKWALFHHQTRNILASKWIACLSRFFRHFHFSPFFGWYHFTFCALSFADPINNCSKRKKKIKNKHKKRRLNTSKTVKTTKIVRNIKYNELKLNARPH